MIYDALAADTFSRTRIIGAVTSFNILFAFALHGVASPISTGVILNAGYVVC